MGIEVRLICPQYVGPFVKTNKNDASDAAAIVDAASRPTMHFVTVKSVEPQDMGAVHRARELLVRQRTALINQVRGLLAARLGACGKWSAQEMSNRAKRSKELTIFLWGRGALRTALRLPWLVLAL